MDNPTDFPSAPNERQTIRQLAWLVDVSLTLNSTLDPDAILGAILDKAAELLECEAVSVLLYDEKRNELFFTAATGANAQELVKIPVPMEGSLAGTIFRENQPLVINNVAEDPRHYGQVGERVKFDARSLLGVPMRIHDKVTGVLEALNKRRGDFDETDVRLLSVIASQAAVAIHNAQLHQALQVAYDELSRIDKIKSDFIAVASHELRTPLGVILGYATFLKEDAHGELSGHADAVLNSALRMQGLIEAMTNMNMLQLGSVRMTPSTLVLQDVIRSAYDETAPTAQASRLAVLLDMPPKACFIEGDPEKLALLFTNLLNNAVRFTPAGGSVMVRVQDTPAEVRVEVQDTGIGIPPQELENIFEEFYQVEGHLTRRHGGLGLGLAIAKGLAGLHGGRIWAESEGPGKGSVFTVVLPKGRE